MSATSPTPGPWITAAGPRPMGYRLEVEEHKTGRVIALCQQRGSNQFGIYGEEAFANARLIAAAPDAVTFAEAVLDESEQPFLRDLARAWLSKATGAA